LKVDIYYVYRYCELTQMLKRRGFFRQIGIVGCQADLSGNLQQAKGMSRQDCAGEAPVEPSCLDVIE
jgi:hypothetical protein